MPDAPPIQPSAGQARPSDDELRSALADPSRSHYDRTRHVFELTIDGKKVTVPPMFATVLVSQNRYLVLGDRSAMQTREMQSQVNRISEANRWLGAVQDAERTGTEIKTPPGTMSDAFKKWLSDNDIDLDDIGTDRDKQAAFENKLSNYVDELSSTNNLKMLELKMTTNKQQESLTLSNGMEQVSKQLWQSIVGDIGR